MEELIPFIALSLWNIDETGVSTGRVVARWKRNVKSVKSSKVELMQQPLRRFKPK